MRASLESSSEKDKRRGFTIVELLIVIVAIATLVAIVGLHFKIGFSSDQAEISALESAAGQFQPGTGWSQDENTVTGSFLCSGVDTPCHSVLRRWHLDHRLSRDEFQGLLDKAGWNLAIKGDCNPPTTSSGLITLCTAQGIIGSYDVDVSIISETKAKPDLLSLRMVKIK